MGKALGIIGWHIGVGCYTVSGDKFWAILGSLKESSK